MNRHFVPPVPPRVTLGAMRDQMQKQADQLIATAALYGFVVTIEQKPLEPLAMGNYETVATVRAVRT